VPPLRDELPLLRDRVPLLRELLEREEPDRDEFEREVDERDDPERDELEREELPERLADVPLRERPPDDRLLELERLVGRERPEERDPLPERERLVERRRVVVARSDRGTSARTTSFTSRPSSASRNFAIRSSSRLMDLASCAVSLSPTASAKVWMRE
jgi:hypothetical protein